MKFAANLSMMFTEVAFADRFQAASEVGFSAVEYLFPYEWEPDWLATKLKTANLQQVLFNMPPGDWEAGERGMASLPGREQEFREGIAKAIKYANALDLSRLHCMAGLRDTSVDETVQRDSYVGNLRYATTQCRDNGIQLLIEPINPVDIPGYFLNDFGLALDIISEVNAAGSALLKLQFDIYHCQKIHGDVPGWLDRCRDQTAHLQIAGVPDRHEPDVGHLPLADIMSACQAIHPDLWIGCEYRPRAQTAAGLGWMKPYI
ncbi:2-oxo-tetronate isomerase [Anderseniella sp. Alg231-50]|uniref:2-oxo-tetronate isomerase n=1 Tax=Anderseniella sp. Alg231-50 TaxID=1922226 RepID=UPI000D54F8FA